MPLSKAVNPGRQSLAPAEGADLTLSCVSGDVHGGFRRPVLLVLMLQMLCLLIVLLLKCSFKVFC